MILQWIELLSAFGAGIAIGSLLRDQTASSPLPDVKPTSAAELDAMVRELVEGGQYLLAIKLYREFHRVDLRDAKTAVDVVRARLVP
jgi:hypothetical protein